MRLIKYIILFSFFINHSGTSQLIRGFPLDKAFFTRESDNYALNNISITNSPSSISKYSLLIKNENGIVYYKKLNSADSINFEFKIVSGLYEYQFQLYRHTNNDSSLIKSASQILCGDAFVIYGQSNGNSFPGVEYYNPSNYKDKWLRNLNFNSSNQLEWYPILQPWANVGTTGLNFAKFISDSLSIPVAVINGSVGGQNIMTLSQRNPENPADYNTMYGRLLYRVKTLGSIKSLKGFLWISGESEAFGNTQEMSQFVSKFDVLYQNIAKDFPPVETFIVLQTNLLNTGSVGDAGYVRSLMTSLMDIYPNVQTIGLAGITGQYSGMHYNREGYEKIAYTMYLFFRYNIYETIKDKSYQSPRILKAVKDYNLNRLRLIFDEKQIVVLPKVVFGASVWRWSYDFVYINDANYQLITIDNVKNEVRLEILDLKNAKYITYLPSYYEDQYSNYYDGPAIKNQHDFPALTFYRFPIGELLQSPSVISENINGNEVSFYLDEKIACQNCKLNIYRKLPNETDFSKVSSQAYPNSVFKDLIPSGIENNSEINYKFNLEDSTSISNDIFYKIKYCSGRILSENDDLNYFFQGKNLIISKALANNNYIVYKNNKTLMLPGFLSNPQKTISVQVKNCNQ